MSAPHVRSPHGRRRAGGRGRLQHAGAAEELELRGKLHERRERELRLKRQPRGRRLRLHQPKVHEPAPPASRRARAARGALRGGARGRTGSCRSGARAGLGSGCRVQDAAGERVGAKARRGAGMCSIVVLWCYLSLSYGVIYHLLLVLFIWGGGPSSNSCMRSHGPSPTPTHTIASGTWG